MPPGRPRNFDTDKALDQALNIFWRKGYEGTTLPDLTHAMGINRPSLYAAFGNKESLFKKALQRYIDGPASYVRAALAQPTARAVAQKLLHEGVKILTDPNNPRGCLAVQGALACGDDADCMRQELIRQRESLVTALRQRFHRAKKERDLPKSSNPSDLARYLATVMHGLSVQASSGASRKDLQKVATLALKAWPT
ncbi:MAG TPA: TetR/AcrR family transcriptional regulator [Tepidisphaeraceae bacterium]|nr:TetR/AcrR family transcriptional regulator [Tepidisphaeraceae bacterium]